MLFDLPLDQLRDYHPDLAAPADLEAFWTATLAETSEHDLDATFRPDATSLLRTVDVFDVTFSGYGGNRISGWLLLPRHREQPLPCVVEFIGYGGGRGLPHEWLDWSAFGYAHLVMDSRGQGSSWRSGVTRDVQPNGAAPHFPGFLTLGLPYRDDYYYRRVYADSVRAVEAARSHPDIDATRIVVAGGSQGGGLAIAAGSLAADVSAVLTDVPFLSHFRRAVDLSDRAPYTELLAWCRVHPELADEAFAALAYFDVAILGRRATAPALFSVGLHDPICPPSTVFAAYNNYGDGTVAKDIRIWQWSEHEGGMARQRAEQVAWLRTVCPAD